MCKSVRSNQGGILVCGVNVHSCIPVCVYQLATLCLCVHVCVDVSWCLAIGRVWCCSWQRCRFLLHLHPISTAIIRFLLLCWIDDHTELLAYVCHFVCRKKTSWHLIIMNMKMFSIWLFISVQYWWPGLTLISRPSSMRRLNALQLNVWIITDEPHQDKCANMHID